MLDVLGNFFNRMPHSRVENVDQSNRVVYRLKIDGDVVIFIRRIKRENSP